MKVKDGFYYGTSTETFYIMEKGTTLFFDTDLHYNDSGWFPTYKITKEEIEGECMLFICKL
jgi:hypothetical protein